MTWSREQSARQINRTWRPASAGPVAAVARPPDWRTARGTRSFGSFHGNMLTSAFGASIAASMATAYGCAGISSRRMSTGVRHVRTKSGVTVKTKSALVRYILVRNLSTISIVITGTLSVLPTPDHDGLQTLTKMSSRSCAGGAAIASPWPRTCPPCRSAPPVSSRARSRRTPARRFRFDGLRPI